MRNQFLNVKSLMFLFVIALLTYGTQGTSYAQVCNVGDVLSPGESCTYVANGVDVVFSVKANGTACRAGGPVQRVIFGATVTIGHTNFCTSDDIERDDTFNSNFSASKNADSSWTINTVPGAVPPPVQQPDLVVERPTVSKSILAPGEDFTLSATVTNQGAGSSPSTTVRYYRSTDATISSNDTEVGTDSVSALGADRSGDESIRLTAPTSVGTYYYGACVGSVDNEDNTNNNCSDAVQITVDDNGQSGRTTYESGEEIPTLPTGFWFPDTVLGGGGGAQVIIGGGTAIVTFGNGGAIIKDGITYTCVAAGGCTVEGRRVTRGTIQVGNGRQTPPPVGKQPDLVLESVEAVPATVEPGQEFGLYATLRNNGTAESAATTVRYYSSTDNIISTEDRQLGTGNRNPLAANGTIRRYLSITAPTTPGTYYYGVCVDRVSNESDTTNNCSAAVIVTVQRTPVVSTPSHPFIYWVDNDTDVIHRANLDGSNVQDLVTGLRCPEGIALDVAGGKMYWTDWCTEEIHSANLDGSNVQTLVAPGLSWLSQIALDVTGGKIYWTGSHDLFGSGTGRIHRANLDGLNAEAIVHGLDSPEGIALDVAGGKMYWVDNDTDKIQRANLNGSNVQDLVTGLRCPEGIALDVAGGKMYWTDWCTNKIHSANLDGSNAQALVSLGFDWPRGIAITVAGGKIYWTGSDELGEPGTGLIQRANLDGSNVQTLVTGLDDPRGIAIGGLSQAVIETVREDVNRDGVVNVQDIVYVAQRYGQTGQNQADVNGDGVVNIDDIVLVAAVVDSTPAAPSIRSQLPKDLTAATVNQWLTEAKLVDKKTPTYHRGILMLEQLLAALTPEDTTLLANYPNPFNPETWIPYHLANDSDVLLSIYDINGTLVRELDLGHQRAGYYTDRSRAAYWDGRNEWGERVASGVYFYQLRAGNYSQMRKMVIVK